MAELTAYRGAPCQGGEAAANRAAAGPERQWFVDDWLELVPVTRAELDVLETFVGQLLGQAFTVNSQPRAADTRAAPPGIGLSFQAARTGEQP